MEIKEIKYKGVEKPFIQIEDHIILPKELVDQLQKVLEDAIAKTEARNAATMEAKMGNVGKVTRIALDTNLGYGISFIIDIAPRGVEEVQKDKIE